MAGQYAFTTMSFSNDTDNVKVYELGIKPAVENLGIVCRRLDEAHYVGSITEAIFTGIKDSYFVIAELTGERPNCYYECGYAGALNKKVIMLIRDGQPIPFNVHNFPFIRYKQPKDLRKTLEERIKQVILTFPHPPTDDDPHRARFGGSAISNGLLLTGAIHPAGEDAEHQCDVLLEVRALPGKPRLEGRVKFYLAEDIEPAESTEPVEDGVASLEFEADWAFTVGAIVNKKTKLELDLATLPGGTPEFYS